MTWVSERSGSASSGMCRIVQTEIASNTSAAAITRYRFSAENRIILLIIASLASHRGQRSAQPRFRVDQEIGPGYHPLALLQPLHHLDLVAGFGSELHFARLELALPQV